MSSPSSLSEAATITFRECFLFPLATPEARKDILVGGLLLFTLIIGWILNLGHRLDVVYRLFHNHPPYFRGFSPWGRTFIRGLKAFGAIICYLSPTGLCLTLFQITQANPISNAFLLLACVFFLLGIFILPGGMTYNAAFNDLSYLYRPDKAFQQAIQGKKLYLKAWLIGLSAILLSFLGVLGFGVGFFFTSVWAWQVVGYAFSKALILKYAAVAQQSSELPITNK